MGFAEDKVYDYILKNLKDFKHIRVASLADSLSCLTDADRDELHSREEARGSHATVYRFYQHLRCRQGWVVDLIEALRHNNAGHLADELQHVYNSWGTHTTVPTAAPFPPVGHGNRPTVSSTGVQTPSLGLSTAPGTLSDKQPCQDLPASDHPPLLSTADTTVSTDLDFRAPVQEALPKPLLQQESPQPPPPVSKVQDGASDGHGAERNISQSMEPTQVTPETVEAASRAERGRDWLSLHQHPVCVDNGCFGNSNHLQRGAPGLTMYRALPRKDVDAACRKEPEENLYISVESAPRLEEATCCRELQPPDSEQTNRAEPSSQQVDVEQKQVRMQEDGRSGDTRMKTTTLVAPPMPRDTSSSCDASLKPPVQEEKLPAVDMTSSTCSVPVEEKVLPALVDPDPPVVESSEGTTGRAPSWMRCATSIWVSCNDMENMEFSKPGVLSNKSPEEASRCLSSQRPCDPYPGVSSSITLSSDPLMISTDSGEALPRVSSECPAPVTCEDPRKDEATGTSRNSHPPLSWDSTTLGTHEVHMDYYHSSGLQDGADHLGDISALDSSTMTSSPRATVASRDSSGSSLPYILPAIALLSMAFLFFTRRQK
ncbi:MAVS protein, partial [Upupa epops]|nr:MAVS protein [Upupa epops]